MLTLFLTSEIKYAILLLTKLKTGVKMNKTKHLGKRMSQRGIKQEMLNLVYEYGRISGDKMILNRKEAQKALHMLDSLIRTAKKTGMAMVVFNDVKYKLQGKDLNIIFDKLNSMRSIFMKIMDKGGITLVIDNNTAITAYNNYK